MSKKILVVADLTIASNLGTQTVRVGFTGLEPILSFCRELRYTANQLEEAARRRFRPSQVIPEDPAPEFPRRLGDRSSGTLAVGDAGQAAEPGRPATIPGSSPMAAVRPDAIAII